MQLPRTRNSCSLAVVSFNSVKTHIISAWCSQGLSGSSSCSSSPSVGPRSTYICLSRIFQTWRDGFCGTPNTCKYLEIPQRIYRYAKNRFATFDPFWNQPACFKTGQPFSKQVKWLLHVPHRRGPRHACVTLSPERPNCTRIMESFFFFLRKVCQ